MAWYIGPACCSRFQSGMRITCDGIGEPQSSSVVEGVRPCMCSLVSPGEGVSRKRGVPIGSVWSRSDGSGIAKTGGSARAGVAAAGGRGTRGGVAPRLEDGRGAPPGPNPYSTAGCITGCCRCSSARRRRRRSWSPKQGRDGHSRTGGRGGVHILCRTP